MSAQVAAARHQVDVLTSRLNSLEAELEDSEIRRKQLASGEHAADMYSQNKLVVL